MFCFIDVRILYSPPLMYELIINARLFMQNLSEIKRHLINTLIHYQWPPIHGYYY